ncbi:MAG: hypothetical protein Q8P02_01975 [Candidatus Micrarchaeota archaeon]|nr:hypothetical protein [Candidatus Micrarchaeota archaeon]
MKCTECDGTLEQKKERFIDLGVDLGEFDALVCNKCGERFYPEKSVDKIQQKQKEKGLWGLEARTKVSQYGNALGFRVSKKLAEFLKLKKGQKVEIVPKGPREFLVKIVEG